eukprot:8406201-Heterocapsa_arctica.AAC.1
MPAKTMVCWPLFLAMVRCKVPISLTCLESESSRHFAARTTAPMETWWPDVATATSLASSLS